MSSTVQNQSWGSYLFSLPSAWVKASLRIPSTVANGALQMASTATSAVTSRVGTTLRAGTNRAVDLFSTGKNAVISRTVQNYAELFFRLHIVGEKLGNNISEGKPLSQVNRNELAERLEEFMHEYSPSAEDKVFLNRLCADLKNTSVSFDKTKEKEMVHLAQILTPHFKEHHAYISSKLAECQQLENLPGLTTTTPVTLSNAETIKGIKQQVDLLKSNAIKMVLGSILLNMTLGLSTIEEINFESLGIDCKKLGIDPPNNKTNLVNFLIEVSNKMKIKGKTSDKVFKILIHRIIDNSGRNVLVRYHAKFRCNYLFSCISSFIGNLFGNLKNTIVDFARLSPVEQLEEITQLLINPLTDHLSEIEKPKVAKGLPKKETLASQIKKMCIALLQNERNPQTPDELLDHFIEVFLSQFLDPIHQPWTRTIRIACLEKAATSNYLVRFVFIVLAVLLWIAGKIIAPFQWTLNETIHFLLKKIVVTICPGLSTATKNSLEIGTPNAWYSLKKNLLIQLQQMRLNSLLPRTADPSYQPPKEIPPALLEKLNTLLDKLVKVLGNQEPSRTDVAPNQSHRVLNFLNGCKDFLKVFLLQDASAAQEQWEKFIEKDEMGLMSFLQHQTHGPLLGSLKDIVKTSIADLALEMCAQEGFINGLLLTSLTGANTNGFAPNTVIITTPEKQRVEEELYKELGFLGGTILQAVQEATRTDKALQSAANRLITTLKQEIQIFHQSILHLHQTPDLPFRANVQKLCLNFTQSMEDLRKKILKTVDAPTQALLIPHLEETLGRAAEISESFMHPNLIEDLRKKVEAGLDELSILLENPLAAEEEIYSILAALKGLNPSFLDIAALEADLSKHLRTYVDRLLDSKVREQHPRVHAKPLLTLIAVYKDKANRNAQIQFKEFKRNLTLELVRLFAQWATELDYVKVTTKPTVKDTGFAFLYSAPIVVSLTSSLIQAYSKNLFQFIGNENNLAEIAQHGMEAFIKKPAMKSRNKRKKITAAPKASKKFPKPRNLLPSLLQKLETRHWAVL